jgi:hypothetical protein
MLPALFATQRLPVIDALTAKGLQKYRNKHITQNALFPIPLKHESQGFSNFFRSTGHNDSQGFDPDADRRR